MKILKILSFLIAAFLILFLISHNSSVQKASTNLLSVAKPFVKILNGAARPFGKILGPNRLARENRVLAKRVSMLEARVAALKDIELENKRLKKLLDMRSQAVPKSIMAGIIAKSVSNWSFSIVLDKGSRGY